MAYDKWAKLEMTPGRLRELNQQHTQAEMAVMLGITEMTVRRWLRKHGIAGIQGYERRVQNQTGLSLAHLTEDNLRHLYEEKLWTDTEIGVRYGVSKTPIRKRREHWGIETISKSERTQRKAPVVSSPEPASPKPQASPKPTKPPQMAVCGWRGCTTRFPSQVGAKYCSETCRRAVDAERARRKRKANQQIGPISRISTCENDACGREWETSEPGNWTRCPSCRAEQEKKRAREIEARRTKVCAHEPCGKSFTDDTKQNSMKFCSTKCRGRAKRLRDGVISSPDAFLENQVRQCEQCEKDYTPKKGPQTFCSDKCRKAHRAARTEKRRRKTCVHCNKPFVDSSPKNNMRAHPDCSREKWGYKPNPERFLDDSPNTASNRRQRVWHGDGGRIDDIRTLKKYTNTWWGRVSELIYAEHRPDADDMNILHGSRAPYDFHDDVYDRVDARGTKERRSPQGRPMWVFNVSGLNQSCDHAFLVGYSEDRKRVTGLWLVPNSDLEPSAMRMSPGSKEYRGDKWDLVPQWGLEKANKKLAELLALPEPERPSDRFAWMDDESNLNDTAPGHRGRKSELLYGRMYPESEDMNRKHGSTYPFDFLDPDGTQVNVKSARRGLKKGSAVSYRWSFSRGVRDQEIGHRCDLYSCLCLAEDGKTVLREYRIPAATWGEKRTIHIYETGGQWDRWTVPNIPVSQQT